MDHATPLGLSNWQNFYVIVGSAAGALTGLQFVVLALITQTRAAASMREIRAFGTPTVIHFCIALLVSAVMTAPWPDSSTLGVCLGIAGTLGSVYSIITFRHAQKATYNPDLEDWTWYAIFPLLGNLGLVGCAIAIWWNAAWAPWGTAADTLLFLVLGIHNSWDTITYVVIEHASGPSRETKTPQQTPPT